MRRLTLIASLLCLSAIIRAQGDTLSLNECCDLALRQNKQMAIASLETLGAGYQAKSLRANFFPSFTANGTALYSNANGSLSIAGGNLPLFLADGSMGGGFAYFPGADIDYKVDGVFLAGVRLEQPLYTGGKIRAAYEMSKLGVEASRLNQRLKAEEVLVETVKAYTQVVEAREMLEVANRYNETLLGLARDVENACRHGLTTRNDVLKVQVRLNESELNIRRSENALRLASMSLCHLLGLPLATSIAIDGALPEVQVTASEAYAQVASRPEYGMLEQQVAIAGQQVRLVRSEKLPQVGVTGGYSYMHGVKVNGEPLFDKGSFSVLLNLSVPLYHFGERANKEAAARTKLEEARLQQDDAAEQMLLEQSLALDNLDEAQLEAELADRSLQQAAENMRVSRSHYDAGLETLSDHLEAQTLWQQAYERQVAARCRLYLSRLEYLKASGQLEEEFPQLQ
ncbi:MAG: TolC family protein [Prevotellaceae bacterium]|nr:TolC family protein [Prevotellaceae bacterium]